jgi:hypothetical protein
MKNITNKIVHSFILAVFSFGCWLTWELLTQGIPRFGGHSLPLFSALCVSLRPVFLVLPILAAVYCLYVWLRKADKVPSWVGFFAATTGSFMLFGFPAVVGAYFALLSVVANLPK